MKRLHLVAAVLVSFVVWINCDGGSRGVNGGLGCAVCSIATGVIQQRAYLQGVSIFEAAKKLCKRFPKKLQNFCYHTVSDLEPLLVDKKFLTLFTPDLFCYALGSCHIDPGEKFCHLFPLPHTSLKNAQDALEDLFLKYDVYDIFNKLQQFEKDDDINLFTNGAEYVIQSSDKNQPQPSRKKGVIKINFCKLPLFNIFCKFLLGTVGELKPMIDLDNDKFSIFHTGRGSDWRGKDCNDLDSTIYPGAHTTNSDATSDGNCNGIHGIDPKSGKPWEEILCDGTEQRGIIYLGDSIGAHFHFPESWMNPNLNDMGSIGEIIEIILDECDWPELGFATGYRNTSSTLIEGLTDSLYLRLRNNNLCSHRDYQNGARNAASSYEGMQEAEAISRNPSDKPALVLYAMMGNDICNRFRDTVGNMTTPKRFRKSVLKTLKILDEKLPLNSNVVLVSLIDASFIYKFMAKRIHPIGSVLNNVYYKDVYSWFSCMQIGPCEGWMTPNITLRKITTQKSVELSNVLKDISETAQFKSFEVHYLQNPFNDVVANWVAQGKPAYKLIDPIDSTHPSQTAQPLMAKAMWKSLKKLGVIGPVNPNNEEIRQLFGDQGGH